MKVDGGSMKTGRGIICTLDIYVHLKLFGPALCGYVDHASR